MSGCSKWRSSKCATLVSLASVQCRILDSVAYTYEYVYTYMGVSIYVYVPAYTYIDVDVHIYMCICAYIYKYMAMCHFSGAQKDEQG